MDNSFPQRGSDMQQPRGFSAGLQIFDRIPNWLARLVHLTQLTESEQRDAGIYLSQLTEEEQKNAGIYLED